MKRDKQNSSSPDAAIPKKQAKADASWKQQRTIAASAPKKFVPASRGMSKLTDQEKIELLRAKLNRTSDKNGAKATQQIHREDPQAGYDQQKPDTEMNGKVSPNPKDARKNAV